MEVRTVLHNSKLQGPFGCQRRVGGRSRLLAFRPVAAKGAPKGTAKSQKSVNYGADWYEATRQRPRTVKEEIEWRRAANLKANNGRERKDLYTDNWDGSVYKGSRFNILTVIALVSILTPLAGLAFAWWSYGVLWG